MSLLLCSGLNESCPCDNGVWVWSIGLAPWWMPLPGMLMTVGAMVVTRTTTWT